jgi:hypothetical protein
VVICDWGSWKKTGAASFHVRGGTEFNRLLEWFGEKKLKGLRSERIAPLDDYFGINMIILSVFAGCRLPFTATDKAAALAFGTSYLECIKSTDYSWLSYWFSQRAFGVAQASSNARLLGFLSSLRRRAGRCKKLITILGSGLPIRLGSKERRPDTATHLSLLAATADDAKVWQEYKS